MKKIKFLCFCWLTIPHVVFYLFAKNKETIDKDIVRWIKCAQAKPVGGDSNNQFDVASGFHDGI